MFPIASAAIDDNPSSMVLVLSTVICMFLQTTAYVLVMLQWFLLLHMARSQRGEHLAMALLRNSTRRKSKGRRDLQVSEVPEFARCPKKKKKLDMLLKCESLLR
jgi:hypothetical protein